MSATWDTLRNSLAPRVKSALGALWDRKEAREFAERKLDDMAKDAWLSANGDTDEIRQVHRDNLEDLWAHVKDEALVMARDAAGGFGEVLGTILKAVAGTLLGALEARLLGRLAP